MTTSPTTYHGTAAEIAFMKALGPRGRFNRLQMLQNYRAAVERRTGWGKIAAGEVLHATDREIAAETKKTLRKAA
jgi:hypothetical protein